MFRTRRHFVRVAIGIFVFALALWPSTAAAAPDSTLYTTYDLFSSSGQTMIEWSVCGSTQQSEGCYGGGQIGPFVTVGSMIEGLPSVKGDVVTRSIFVVDSGSAAVKLYIYKKTDTVTSSFDTVSVILTKTIDLPLTGGSSAAVSTAANDSYLFVGTNLSPQAVEIHKGNYAVTQLPSFDPPINVTAISADQYGYVTITQGDTLADSGMYVIGPNGSVVEDGGGLSFTVGTMEGFIPNSNLIEGTPRSARSLGYRLKANANAGVSLQPND